MTLSEQTNLIKHYLKAWSNNILEIGKVLNEIIEKKSYKEKYSSFEIYIEDNFAFKHQYAYKIVQVYKKYGQNVARLDKLKDYGMRILILSIAVPDDYVDEMLEEIKTIPHPKGKELAKIVKRFSNQAGKPSRHSPQDQEEHILKLEREAGIIKQEYQDYLNIKTNLTISIENWVKSASKYPQLSNLKEELEILKVDLK